MVDLDEIILRKLHHAICKYFNHKNEKEVESLSKDTKSYTTGNKEFSINMMELNVHEFGKLFPWAKVRRGCIERFEVKVVPSHRDIPQVQIRVKTVVVVLELLDSAEVKSGIETNSLHRIAKVLLKQRGIPFERLLQSPLETAMWKVVDRVSLTIGEIQLIIVGPNGSAHHEGGGRSRAGMAPGASLGLRNDSGADGKGSSSRGGGVRGREAQDDSSSSSRGAQSDSGSNGRPPLSGDGGKYTSSSFGLVVRISRLRMKNPEDGDGYAASFGGGNSDGSGLQDSMLAFKVVGMHKLMVFLVPRSDVDDIESNRPLKDFKESVYSKLQDQVSSSRPTVLATQIKMKLAFHPHPAEVGYNGRHKRFKYKHSLWSAHILEESFQLNLTMQRMRLLIALLKCVDMHSQARKKKARDRRPKQGGANMVDEDDERKDRRFQKELARRRDFIDLFEKGITHELDSEEVERFQAHHNKLALHEVIVYQTFGDFEHRKLGSGESSGASMGGYGGSYTSGLVSGDISDDATARTSGRRRMFRKRQANEDTQPQPPSLPGTPTKGNAAIDAGNSPLRPSPSRSDASTPNGEGISDSRKPAMPSRNASKPSALVRTASRMTSNAAHAMRDAAMVIEHNVEGAMHTAVNHLRRTHSSDHSLDDVFTDNIPDVASLPSVYERWRVTLEINQWTTHLFADHSAVGKERGRFDFKSLRLRCKRQILGFSAELEILTVPGNFAFDLTNFDPSNQLDPEPLMGVWPSDLESDLEDCPSTESSSAADGGDAANRNAQSGSRGPPSVSPSRVTSRKSSSVRIAPQAFAHAPINLPTSKLARSSLTGADSVLSDAAMLNFRLWHTHGNGSESRKEFVTIQEYNSEEWHEEMRSSTKTESQLKLRGLDLHIRPSLIYDTLEILQLYWDDLDVLLKASQYPMRCQVDFKGINIHTYMPQSISYSSSRRFLTFHFRPKPTPKPKKLSSMRNHLPAAGSVAGKKSADKTDNGHDASRNDDKKMSKEEAAAEQRKRRQMKADAHAHRKQLDKVYRLHRERQGDGPGDAENASAKYVSGLLGASRSPGSRRRHERKRNHQHGNAMYDEQSTGHMASRNEQFLISTNGKCTSIDGTLRLSAYFRNDQVGSWEPLVEPTHLEFRVRKDFQNSTESVNVRFGTINVNISHAFLIVCSNIVALREHKRAASILSYYNMNEDEDDLVGLGVGSSTNTSKSRSHPPSLVRRSSIVIGPVVKGGGLSSLPSENVAHNEKLQTNSKADISGLWVMDRISNHTEYHIETDVVDHDGCPVAFACGSGSSLSELPYMIPERLIKLRLLRKQQHNDNGREDGVMSANTPPHLHTVLFLPDPRQVNRVVEVLPLVSTSELKAFEKALAREQAGNDHGKGKSPSDILRVMFDPDERARVWLTIKYDALTHTRNVDFCTDYCLRNSTDVEMEVKAKFMHIISANDSSGSDGLEEVRYTDKNIFEPPLLRDETYSFHVKDQLRLRSITINPIVEVDSDTVREKASVRSETDEAREGRMRTYSLSGGAKPPAAPERYMFKPQTFSVKSIPPIICCRSPDAHVNHFYCAPMVKQAGKPPAYMHALPSNELSMLILVPPLQIVNRLNVPLHFRVVDLEELSTSKGTVMQSSSVPVHDANTQDKLLLSIKIHGYAYTSAVQITKPTVQSLRLEARDEFGRTMVIRADVSERNLDIAAVRVTIYVDMWILNLSAIPLLFRSPFSDADAPGQRPDIYSGIDDVAYQQLIDSMDEPQNSDDEAGVGGNKSYTMWSWQNNWKDDAKRRRRFRLASGSGAVVARSANSVTGLSGRAMSFEKPRAIGQRPVGPGAIADLSGSWRLGQAAEGKTLSGLSSGASFGASQASLVSTVSSKGRGNVTFEDGSGSLGDISSGGERETSPQQSQYGPSTDSSGNSDHEKPPRYIRPLHFQAVKEWQSGSGTRLVRGKRKGNKGKRDGQTEGSRGDGGGRASGGTGGAKYGFMADLKATTSRKVLKKVFRRALGKPSKKSSIAEDMTVPLGANSFHAGRRRRNGTVGGVVVVDAYSEEDGQFNIDPPLQLSLTSSRNVYPTAAYSLSTALRVRGCPYWSSNVNLSSDGITTVDIVDSSQDPPIIFNLVVAVEKLGQGYKHTKLVKVTPRYVMVNECGQKIEYRKVTQPHHDATDGGYNTLSPMAPSSVAHHTETSPSMSPSATGSDGSEHSSLPGSNKRGGAPVGDVHTLQNNTSHPFHTLDGNTHLQLRSATGRLWSGAISIGGPDRTYHVCLPPPTEGLSPSLGSSSGNSGSGGVNGSAKRYVMVKVQTEKKVTYVIFRSMTDHELPYRVINRLNQRIHFGQAFNDELTMTERRKETLGEGDETGWVLQEPLQGEQLEISREFASDTIDLEHTERICSGEEGKCTIPLSDETARGGQDFAVAFCYKSGPALVIEIHRNEKTIKRGKARNVSQWVQSRLVTFHFVFCADTIGVTLIDGGAQEIMHVVVSRAFADVIDDEEVIKTEIWCEGLQVDNQILHGRPVVDPVILCPTYPTDCFIRTHFMLRRESEFWNIVYFNIDVKDTSMRIDTQLMAVVASNFEMLRTRYQQYKPDSVKLIENHELLLRALYDDRQHKGQVLSDLMVSPTQQTKRAYVHQFFISSFVVDVLACTTSVPSEPYLRPSREVEIFLRSLEALDDVRFDIAKLYLHNEAFVPLKAQTIDHYRKQFRTNAPRLLFSLRVLGNPAGIVMHIADSVRWRKRSKLASGGMNRDGIGATFIDGVAFIESKYGTEREEAKQRHKSAKSGKNDGNHKEEAKNEGGGEKPESSGDVQEAVGSLTPAQPSLPASTMSANAASGTMGGGGGGETQLIVNATTLPFEVASNLALGATRASANSVSLLACALSELLVNVSGDRRLHDEHIDGMRRRYNGAWDALRAGATGIAAVVPEALHSAVLHVTEGRQRGGIEGVAQGMVVGTAGLVIRPIVSMFDAVAISAGGLRNSLGWKKELFQPRLRIPQPVNYEGVVREYNAAASTIHFWLNLGADGGGSSGDVYERHIELGHKILVMTGVRIIYARKPATSLANSILSKFEFIWQVRVRDILNVLPTKTGVLLRKNHREGGTSELKRGGHMDCHIYGITDSELRKLIISELRSHINLRQT